MTIGDDEPTSGEHRCSRSVAWGQRVVSSLGVRRLGLIVTAVVAFGTVVGDVATAHATGDDGLQIEATSTFEFEPDAGIVRVTVDARVTNTVPDRHEGGGVHRVYFESIVVPLTDQVVEVTASSGDTPLDVVLQRFEGEPFSVAEVRLARDLYWNETTDVQIAYRFVGGPRSTGPSRINAAQVAFPALPFGDAGVSRVRVVVPVDFTAEVWGLPTESGPDGWNSSGQFVADDAGRHVWDAEITPDVEGSAFVVVARDDEALTAQIVEVDDVEFDVRSWPGDVEWAAMVAESIEEGVPVLSERLGLPLTVEAPLTVRQTLAPELAGYGGWYDHREGLIEIGETLDREVILHELSHAWFNRTMFTDTWVLEGFAETFTAVAMEELDGVVLSPDRVDRSAPEAFPLAEWRTYGWDRWFDDGLDRELYGYNTAWFVIESLRDEIGDAAMQEVLLAVMDARIAYPGETERERVRFPVSWRGLLDLAENYGGSAEFDGLLREYVLGESDIELLDERTAARDRYAEVEATADDWSMPIGIRTAMTAWRFDDALLGLDAAARAIAARDDLETAARDLGLDLPSGAENDFEATWGGPRRLVGELDEIAEGLERERGALDLIAAVHVERLEAETAVEALDLDVDLEPVERSMRDAFEARRPDDVDAAADRATESLAAWLSVAEQVATARERADAEPAIVPRIGLIGVDVHGEVDQAIAAFSSGDRDAAAARAAQVIDVLDDADDVGLRRLGVAASVVAAVVLAGLIGAVIRRQRRRASGVEPVSPCRG